MRTATVPAAAVVMAAVMLAALTAGSFAAGVRTAPATSAEPARSEVSLLGQSTWVSSGKMFDLRIGLPAGLAPTDQIQVTAYSRLSSRSYFDQAADGQTGEDVWLGSETVGSAPRAAAGGVWARVPVDAVPGAGDLEGEAFDPGDQSGVYPLKVQIVGANYAAIGGSLSAFLVYSANQSDFPRLAVTLTVPVTATPTLSSALVATTVTPAESRSLSALGTTLTSHPGVALDLAVSPQTAAALRVGSATDRATLSRLAALVHDGDEVLPAPYVPVSLSGLDTAGLDQPGPGDQLASQLAEGSAVLRADLGVTPDTSTWVFDGGTTGNLDDSTVQRLHLSGLKDVIVPASAVTGLASRFTTTTYGRPTILDDGGDPDLRVMTTDPVLERRVTQPTGPVLAAEQTLAELAMIELETPSIARGIAFSLPEGGSASGVYLSTLLAGLRSNPFVRTVTASGLFAGVTDRVPATVAAEEPTTAGGAAQSGATQSGAAQSGATKIGASTQGVPVRSLRPLPVAPVAAAGLLGTLDSRIGGLAAMLPLDTQLVARLRQQLLVAPAAGLTPTARGAVLASMQSQIASAISSVRLPGNTSVTLTSLKATVPLTVFSGTGLSPHVLLSLDSPKLSFRAYRPPFGTCTVTGRTSETCNLVLHGPDELLKVPVEARTSGVFFLDVALTSPDGSLTLAATRDTVRSEAVSFVGIVIIVVALVLLGIWWLRDIRSGRRARELVARPGDGIDDEDGGPPDGGIGPEPTPPPPLGPAEPVLTPGRLVPADGMSGPPAGVLAGKSRQQAPVNQARVNQAPAHRARHLPRHRRDAFTGDAPTGLRPMSPSPPPTGPIGRAEPPEEPAP